MSTYRQNPRGQSPQNAPAAERPEGADNQIRVDGFAQVLALLQHADPEFRESLLRRIAARDRDLARNLRADLGI